MQRGTTFVWNKFLKNLPLKSYSEQYEKVCTIWSYRLFSQDLDLRLKIQTQPNQLVYEVYKKDKIVSR